MDVKHLCSIATFEKSFVVKSFLSLHDARQVNQASQIKSAVNLESVASLEGVKQSDGHAFVLKVRVSAMDVAFEQLCDFIVRSEDKALVELAVLKYVFSVYFRVHFPNYI